MSILTKYPQSIDDSTSLPDVRDLVTPIAAVVVNRIKEAVISIETELGPNPSGVFSSVKDRLESLRSDINTIENELGSNPSGSFDTVADRINSITLDLSGAISDIASIQSELGSNPSGTFGDVEDRLDDVDNSIANLESELGSNPSGAFSDVSTRLDDVDAQITAVNAYAEVLTQINAGNQSTDSTTYTSIGACVLNPTSLGYPSVTFSLEAILQTTNSSYAVSFELFNVTEGVEVSHPSISTVSTSANFVSVTLTVGGADLPDGQDNVLEGRIKLASGASTSDRAICKYAAIRSTPI